MGYAETQKESNPSRTVPPMMPAPGEAPAPVQVTVQSPAPVKNPQQFRPYSVTTHIKGYASGSIFVVVSTGSSRRILQKNKMRPKDR